MESRRFIKSVCRLSLVFFSVIAYVIVVSCQSRDAHRPGRGGVAGSSSLEQLRASFIQAYESADVEAMKALFLTESVSDDAIEANLQVCFLYAGKHKVAKTEFTEFPPEKVDAYLSMGQKSPAIPKWMFYVRTLGNEGFQGEESIAEINVPVGTVQGRFYICISAE